MKASLGFALGLAATSSSAHAFHQQPVWRIQQHVVGTDVKRAGDVISELPATRKRVPLVAPLARRKRAIRALRASSADPSSATPRNKKGKNGKVSVKRAVELWADESLELHRFHRKRVHVCTAKTLPEVLSEFWELVAQCAQAKFAAMSDDRDYAAHVLFVVAECDLLKDYSMMRHLDKVLDFCSGGSRDFGRTITLQHYHPDFTLPPSQDHANDHSNALARVVDFSRSPYPAFGLTAAGGSAARSSPLEAGDKIGRLRLDLEMVYNSAAGCSTDDNVDAHGSEHGTIPSSPVEVEQKTSHWLSKLKARQEAPEAGGSLLAPSLAGVEDVVTSGLSTPEEVMAQIWSIVTQLQGRAALLPHGSTAGAAAAGRGHDNASGGDAEDTTARGRDALASTLLVAPRLHPFNSAQFDNFARSLAIALKQTPIMERIEIEVYHPEFVGDGGVVDLDRRSPFPTLLLMHCGLKEELFEPSGMYRHKVPPLALPAETGPVGHEDEDANASSPGTEAASEAPADDAEV